jgi:hypothetical protein
VTRGGFIVAAVQAIMVVHSTLGVVAALLWGEVAGRSAFSDPGWRAEVDGFVVTLLVAQPLLAAA